MEGGEERRQRYWCEGEEIEGCERACRTRCLSNKPTIMLIYALLGRGENCYNIVIRKEIDDS